MKRFLLTLATSLIAFGVFAQEHLSFKGIPIEGSMTSFCQKLVAKGFNKIGTQNNITLFVGDFTGRQATVGVAATDDGKSVHSVVVVFDESSEWNTLVKTYNYYKDLYIRKYGNPSVSEEYNPSRREENTSLMYELSQGKVTYASVWEVTGGIIELVIEKANDYMDGMVTIRYRDAQNIEAKIQHDLDDI